MKEDEIEELLPDHLTLTGRLDDTLVLVYDENSQETKRVDPLDFGDSEWQILLEQYEKVRLTGATNMGDVGMVQKIAYELDLYELVIAIEEDKFSDLLLRYSRDRVLHVKPPEVDEIEMKETIDIS